MYQHWHAEILEKGENFMNMIPVSSSRMSSVGWDNNKMYVRFKDGAMYEYSNVSEPEFKSFINSSSLGKELNSFQTRHPYHRI